ncbi:hypothetical protein [Streptomyces sp. NPDC008121]|uniref:hypothetical protein n=1 Tax=Streptomyces sp. NPDC008121 TaxID=3364809 RepID=UPI0036EDF1A1
MLRHDARLTLQIAITGRNGDWITQERTGLAILVCNCGYDSGWTELASIKDEFHKHMPEPLSECVSSEY